MNLLSLGLRNVLRYRHRSLVTTGAMAFSGAVMVFYAALLDGWLASAEDHVVAMSAGDVQIHQRGYRDDPDLYTRFDAQPVLMRLREAGYVATPRLFGFGLLAAGHASAGVALRAIDVKAEAQVTELHQHLFSGQWLQERDQYGVVLGRKLARTLNVKPGSEVVFVGQAADGSLANELFYVRGILKGVDEEIDRAGVIMQLADFRQLMAVPEGAHEVVLRRGRHTGISLNDMRREVDTLAPGLDVRHWRQLQPVVSNILEMADSQMLFLLLITYVAMATVIINAVLMSVFERIHEFGVMRAIGVTPFQLMRLVYLETLLQALLAATLSALAGIALILWVGDEGIDLSRWIADASFAGIAFDPVWRPLLSASTVLGTLGLMILVALLAVIYPAAKAALIKPLAAIHHH